MDLPQKADARPATCSVDHPSGDSPALKRARLCSRCSTARTKAACCAASRSVRSTQRSSLTTDPPPLGNSRSSVRVTALQKVLVRLLLLWTAMDDVAMVVGRAVAVSASSPESQPRTRTAEMASAALSWRRTRFRRCRCARGSVTVNVVATAAGSTSRLRLAPERRHRPNLEGIQSPRIHSLPWPLPRGP